MVSISYGILVCSEHWELDRLLSLLIPYVRPEDEIVVLVDSQKATCKVYDTLACYPQVIYQDGYFTGNFAAWRNLLTTFCSKDWIFQIDADEFVSPYLIQDLPYILDSEKNGGVEMDGLIVPRMNTVQGITEKDIRKWGWHMEPNGRINWPDFQTRIFKNNGKVCFHGKVHERLGPVVEGTELKFSKVPPQMQNTWVLFHPKSIERQRKQNALYDTYNQ